MEREPKIILASASPRRAELLAKFGVQFAIEPSHIDESTQPDESPVEYITRLALAKVRDVGSRHQDGLIIGADTTVVFEGEILGKPQDEAAAFKMLRALAGRWHIVMTSVALLVVEAQREIVSYEKTMVRFARMNDEEIKWYLASGEYKDKAGAYGIQGSGGIFVKEIAGNYHNVVGLPLPLVYKLSQQVDYRLLG